MKIISPIVDIGGHLVVPIRKHFCYLSCYNSHIKSLKDQFQKLGDKRAGVQLEIDAAKQNGEVIASEVESWVEKVDNISEGLQRFLEEDVKENVMCLNGWCPNLKSHYFLSRQAKKKTLEIDGLLRDGQFDKVSNPPPPPWGIATSSKEGFKVFESRIPVMKELLTALRDDKINMIAICGMEGIGKTTMAKEVAKRAKDDNLFDEVVMVAVSRKKDLSKIEDQIAMMRHREINFENVLVILDNVMEELNLKDEGIPYKVELNSCKILLTSRSEEVCNQMKSHKIVRIEALTEEEAWSFFKEMAGNCIDTPNLHPIAEKVVKECKGIPIAIVTIGRALENKRKNEWVSALQQLRKSISKNNSGSDSTVYSSIELTYNFLASDEAKSCFLLCCLFPKDYDIPIEYLVKFGVGQRLFAENDKVAEARNRVHEMVDNLRRSSLLLDSDEEECVKMHDVARGVAISIANGHVCWEEWTEKDTYEHYVAISIVSQELKNHPDGLECPKLELLQLSCGKDATRQTLPTNLFKGMMGLKVLAMQGMSFPSLPQSIQVLQNLQTLLLEYCEIKDVSAIGALGKLEMLSFLGSEIKELPKEIGNLSHLKLLDLSECSALQHIPPGLLSSLSRLEELYMGNVSVMNWEPMEGNREGANASLAELRSFSDSLMALRLHIPNIKLLPKDLHFKNQMIKFQIYACDEPFRHQNFGKYSTFWNTTQYIFKNSLALEGFVASDIAESWIPLLLQKSEFIALREIKDFENILYKLDFPCLEVLLISSSDVEYLIDATSYQTPRVAFPILESLILLELPNLKEIYHSRIPQRSFSARGLVQLQELEIQDCEDMEEIFHKEGEDEKALNDKIMFPQLTSINMDYLPGLIGFCTGVGPVELVQPSLLNQEVRRIDTFGSDRMTNIQQTAGFFPDSTPISQKFFSSKTILWQPNLKELSLEGLHERLEVVFDLEGQKDNNDHQRIAVLAKLKTLRVIGLSNLRYVWKNVPQGIQGFQNLTSINVYRCHKLRYLFPPTVAKLLVELQSIKISWCGMIENIVQRDGEEEAEDIILLPKLTSFYLSSLPNVMSFCIEPYSFEWSSIEKIYMYGCPKFKTYGKLQKINWESDSIPQDQEPCLKGVPSGRNDSLTVASDQGTTKKLQESSSVNKEGILTKDPRANDIYNNSKTWPFFPSHLIVCLKNLKTMKLSNYDSLEVIFQLEELKVEESHMAPILDQLRILDLSDLPKLMHIWKKGPERNLGFGNLRLLKVSGCDSLTYLFSPSIAKLLVMLEKIEVSSCKKIEEILARAGEEEKEKDVLFNKVNSIVLHNLPNLKCFCSETNALGWPSLREIRVIKCPSLSTFIPSNLNTPKLEGVDNNHPWIEERTCHWKGDLNATIEHIFKGKEKPVDH
nr:putative disease resistance protein [Quercus suber]